MKRVAVFGRPGGGKSTLSKQLAERTGIALYPVDKMLYREGGKQVSTEIFEKKHSELLKQDTWLIEGLGTISSFERTLTAADTLIYIDLPVYIHYWWVLKRLLRSPFLHAEGWPARSPMLRGTYMSIKYLRLSNQFWTAEFVERLNSFSADKNVYHVKSVKQLAHMLKALAPH